MSEALDTGVGSGKLVSHSMNLGPRRSGGATIGKTILTCVYVEKKSSEPAGQFQTNLVEIILG
jgi:hypothetical protein